MASVRFICWALFGLCAVSSTMAHELVGCWRQTGARFTRDTGQQMEDRRECVRLYGENTIHAQCKEGYLSREWQLRVTGPGKHTIRLMKENGQSNVQPALDLNHTITGNKLVVYDTEYRGAGWQKNEFFFVGANDATCSSLKQQSEAKSPPNPTSQQASRIVARSDRCVPGSSPGASSIIGIAAPGFDFRDDRATRTAVESLLAQAPRSTACGSVIAILMSEGGDAKRPFVVPCGT